MIVKKNILLMTFLFSILAMIALSGCGERCKDDVMFRGNLERTGVFKTKGLNKLNEIKWQFKTGGEINSSPAISDGVVYFGSEDSYLYAVNIKTGQEKWKFKTKAGIYSSPAILDGVIYFGSEDSYLYAVDIKTGQEKWKFKTEAQIFSSPAISDGVVYFGGGDSYLYALQ